MSKAPIRSPRRIYELEGMTVNLDDNPSATDEAPTQTVEGTVRNVIVKMKQAIGDYFGLEPIPSNSPIMIGTFQGNGLNKGSQYYRNIGGFKVASYTFVAKSFFEINESYYEKETGLYIEAPRSFRTMTVGFPKGHSVNEVMFLLNSWDNNDKVSHLVTPAGKKHGYYFVEGL